MADAELIRDIKSAEGCKLIAYKDGEGYWTIGYGHLLDQSIDWTGHEITQDTADQLLAQDIDARAAQAALLPEWTALDTPCRQNAVIECIFNLGASHWVKEFPRTRSDIKVQSWKAAAADLMNSPEWIKEVGRARVARLAGYLQSGSYSPLRVS